MSLTSIINQMRHLPVDKDRSFQAPSQTTVTFHHPPPAPWLSANSWIRVRFQARFISAKALRIFLMNSIKNIFFQDRFWSANIT